MRLAIVAILALVLTGCEDMQTRLQRSLDSHWFNAQRKAGLERAVRDAVDAHLGGDYYGVATPMGMSPATVRTFETRSSTTPTHIVLNIDALVVLDADVGRAVRFREDVSFAQDPFFEIESYAVARRGWVEVRIRKADGGVEVQFPAVAERRRDERDIRNFDEGVRLLSEPQFLVDNDAVDAYLTTFAYSWDATDWAELWMDPVPDFTSVVRVILDTVIRTTFRAAFE